MDNLVTQIVVVGGGTAGWLSACRLAAANSGAVSVTLVESPDVPTIGVGEGTWPTIRGTLQAIGLAESDFLTACDAWFKQGSRFDGWRDGAAGDSYYHPFGLPPAAAFNDVVDAWRRVAPDLPFAECVSSQPALCDLNLAPRQRAMPDYAGAMNYAYHLDAGKLATLLRDHAVNTLGVRHVRDHVMGVEAGEGGIAAVRTRDHGVIAGDFFIDCSGHAALLIGNHFGVPFIDRGAELFNDRALAVQVPVPEDSDIASHTNATAHAAGWTWDIGLPTRRGIGCVYSSAHLDDAGAEATLSAYLRDKAPWARLDALSPRRLSFRSGHRERFWQDNCLAIGQSAGFSNPSKPRPSS